ncbi:hypothetical protein [Acidithiobacillus sp. HP-11]|uniref:hypothetical protein n=1 Tax=Acidithiobacillus sp. HP-11 TaxID=2697656 RepID=UPI00187A85F9|nr:hypothetical protein [Acidithiobacillus sp. HP-11]MBE7567812.1 hypothetical protein [Acidithiobacillus sp. HP-11]
MITEKKGNLTNLELERVIPHVIDLMRKERGDIDVLNRELERIFTPQMEFSNRFDFRHALDYLAGLEQKVWQRDLALQYLEKIRGTPDFTIFCNAMFKMQTGIVRRRRKKEAMERRMRGPVVEDVAKSKRTDFISRSPNLTKSYVKSPNRLKVVN